MSYAVALLISILMVLAITSFHSFMLHRIGNFAFTKEYRRTHHMLVIVWMLMGIHFVEMVFSAFTVYAAHMWFRVGGFHGTHDYGLMDYFQLAAESYTTVGFGDPAPVGALSIVTSHIGLTGLLMIAWTGSFTYLAIQKLWWPNK